jgi:hypothetical protein
MSHDKLEETDPDTIQALQHLARNPFRRFLRD